MKTDLKYFFKIFLFLLLVGSIYITFLTFKSLVGQYKLALDIGKFEYTPEEVDLMLPPIPNITAVTIPINVSKAMYLIRYNRPLEAVLLIDEAEKAQPYTHVGEYLKSRVFIANGVLDSAYSNAKRAFYGWPKNIQHYTTYNEVLVWKKDTLEILNAYKSLDSVLAAKPDFKKSFVDSYNNAKFAYLITNYSDERNITPLEVQGKWVRGYNFPNNKFIPDNNYTFDFQDETVTNNLGDAYAFKIIKDSLAFYFVSNKNKRLNVFGLKYSDSLKTLILKGIKLENGTVQDQFYKRVD